MDRFKDKIVKLADIFWVTGVPGSGKSHMMNEFRDLNNMPSRVLVIDLDKYGYWTTVELSSDVLKDRFMIDYDPVITDIYKENCWSYDAIVLFGICDNFNDIIRTNYIAGVFNIDTPVDIIAKRLDARAEIYRDKEDEGAKNFLANLKTDGQSSSEFASKCIVNHSLHSDNFVQITTVQELFDGILQKCSLLSAYMAKEFRDDWGRQLSECSVSKAAEAIRDEHKWSQNGKE